MIIRELMAGESGENLGEGTEDGYLDAEQRRKNVAAFIVRRYCVGQRRYMQEISALGYETDYYQMGEGGSDTNAG